MTNEEKRGRKRGYSWCAVRAAYSREHLKHPLHSLHVLNFELFECIRT